MAKWPKQASSKTAVGGWTGEVGGLGSGSQKGRQFETLKMERV